MDPNDNDNGNGNGNGNGNDNDNDKNNSRKKISHSQQQRAIERVVRRFQEEQQRGRRRRSGGSSSGGSSNNNSNNNDLPRPEVASSLMGNRNNNNNNNNPNNPRRKRRLKHPPGDSDGPKFANAGRRLKKKSSIRRRNNNNNNNLDDRNNNREDFDRNGPPPVAAASANNDGAESPSNNNDNNDIPPLLSSLLNHLQEFCRVGANSGGPPSSAINVEKARNILEACAGNVQLAGQLYWDDYFATQANHHQDNPAPEDAPSAAEAADAEAAEDAAAETDAERERRIRRRLENDFARLLPGRNPPAPHAAAAAAGNDGSNLLRAGSRSRRRRRSAESDGGVLGAVVRRNDNNNNNVINNNNNRHNVEEDALMGDAEGEDQDENHEQDNQAPDAPEGIQVDPDDRRALLAAAQAVLWAGGDDGGEGSVSVSDDEAAGGILRIVRERAQNLRTRGHPCRRRGSSFEDNPDYIRAREMIHAQFPVNANNSKQNNPSKVNRRKRKAAKSFPIISIGTGGGGGNDPSSSSDGSSDSGDNYESDDDGYLSEHDWLLASQFRDPALSEASSNSSTSQPSQQLRAPLDVLWSGLEAHDRAAVRAEKKFKKKKKKSDDDDNDEMKGSAEKIKIKKEDDVDDKKQDDNADDDDGNNGNDDESHKRPEIPSTWLHASFTPDSTAFGLALKNPKPEDVAENSLYIQQNSADGSPTSSRRSNTLPLPYHCRAVTAVLSVVTAIMYTNASVQSNEITCSSSRVPFLELKSKEARTREFENRLIDALSSLIFIAARASRDRKQKALSKLLAKKDRKRKRRKKKKEEHLSDDEDDDSQEPDISKVRLQRKLKLCPVSWWKAETAQSEPVQPAAQWHQSADNMETDSPWIQVATSYSNISDIRAYVWSNMRSFTAPGGVALLLETIVGIHGAGAVARMLRKSRSSGGVTGVGAGQNRVDPVLIRCTCEERQRKRLQDPKLTAAARRKLMNALDTTPPGHCCVSVNLISLLLTGKIQSSWRGWGTGPLGFGILSERVGEMGSGLSRPDMPVWVLKGDTCYSVLLMDHTNHGDDLDERCGVPKKSNKISTTNKNNKGKTEEKKPFSLSPSKPKAAPCLRMSQCSSTSRIRDLYEAQQFAQNDKPGFIANMVHWNCWFGDKNRNLSGLRLITDRPKWSPPSPSKIVKHYREDPKAPHSLSLSCQRKSVVQQLQERRNSLANVVSADEREAVEIEKATVDARKKESAMESIRFHPDDAKFYPKNFRLWRFDMPEDEEAERDLDSKPRGSHFISYYSLSREQQMLVEAKFGPKINRILWTRWPGATIDKFTPEGKNEGPPLV